MRPSGARAQHSGAQAACAFFCNEKERRISQLFIRMPSCETVKPALYCTTKAHRAPSKTPAERNPPGPETRQATQTLFPSSSSPWTSLCVASRAVSVALPRHARVAKGPKRSRLQRTLHPLVHVVHPRRDTHEKLVQLLCRRLHLHQGVQLALTRHQVLHIRHRDSANAGARV